MAIILAIMNIFSIEKSPLEVQLEVANRFKSIRKQKKIAQSQLAKKSGVSLGSLKRFEQTGQISFESLLLLSNYFDRLDEFDKIFQPVENQKEIENLFKNK